MLSQLVKLVRFSRLIEIQSSFEAWDGTHPFISNWFMSSRMKHNGSPNLIFTSPLPINKRLCEPYGQPNPFSSLVMPLNYLNFLDGYQVVYNIIIIVITISYCPSYPKPRLVSIYAKGNLNSYHCFELFVYSMPSRALDL